MSVTYCRPHCGNRRLFPGVTPPTTGSRIRILSTLHLPERCGVAQIITPQEIWSALKLSAELQKHLVVASSGMCSKCISFAVEFLFSFFGMKALTFHLQSCSCSSSSNYSSGNARILLSLALHQRNFLRHSLVDTAADKEEKQSQTSS